MRIEASNFKANLILSDCYILCLNQTVYLGINPERSVLKTYRIAEPF